MTLRRLFRQQNELPTPQQQERGYGRIVPEDFGAPPGTPHLPPPSSHYVKADDYPIVCKFESGHITPSKHDNEHYGRPELHFEVQMRVGGREGIVIPKTLSSSSQRLIRDLAEAEISGCGGMWFYIDRKGQGKETVYEVEVHEHLADIEAIFETEHAIEAKVREWFT